MLFCAIYALGAFLEIAFVAQTSVLTAAVILSGGKVKLPGGGEFVLPSLGSGIKSLIEAFKVISTTRKEGKRTKGARPKPSKGGSGSISGV